jgi:hypothetical protein
VHAEAEARLGLACDAASDKQARLAAEAATHLAHHAVHAAQQELRDCQVEIEDLKANLTQVPDLPRPGKRIVANRGGSGGQREMALGRCSLGESQTFASAGGVCGFGRDAWGWYVRGCTIPAPTLSRATCNPPAQVSTMMTRLHRKQYGDTSMADELSKHSTRHRMELMMRQLALVQHRCVKFKDGLDDRELLLRRLRRDGARQVSFFTLPVTLGYNRGVRGAVGLVHRCTV